MELVRVPDDGLYTPTIKPWTLEKYRHVWHYDGIFSRGMRKWEDRIYIDLFAGAGYSALEGSGDVYLNSAFLALEIDVPFTGYVFCEKEPKSFDALRTRVLRDYPEAPVRLIHGDCNGRVEDIVRNIRNLVTRRGFLSFCFMDPFSIGLKFSTIAALEHACGRIDFMILLALEMDARRNEQLYCAPSCPTVDDLLADPAWRVDYAVKKNQGIKFTQFIVTRFGMKMQEIGYLPSDGSQMRVIKERANGKTLYRLAFYSKHPRGHEFWGKIKPLASSQQELGL